MNSDCYEKGHTPNRSPSGAVCAKCGKPLFRVNISGLGVPRVVWHTQAELDRLWQGVDREAMTMDERRLCTCHNTGSYGCPVHEED